MTGLRAQWMAAGYREAKPVAKVHRRGTGAVVAGFLMLALGLALLLPAPPIVYRCEPGEGGVRCSVSQRVAGLWERDRVEVAGIRQATGATYEVAAQSRAPASGSNRESVSSLTFLGAKERPLYAGKQSDQIGSEAGEIADGVNALAAGGRKTPFLRWQMSWIEALFASVMLVIAVPTLVDTARVRITRSPGSAPVFWAEFAVAAVPLAIGWWLALEGSFPDAIAAALGLPTG